LKRFKDMVNLRGQQDEITMMELRNAPGEVIDQAGCGKTWIITRDGRQLAAIIPLPRVGEPQVELTIKVDKKGRVTF
jgi:antitoxin (DNA-binding transcriptional repressor) of toxin-antitoxin stability system